MPGVGHQVGWEQPVNLVPGELGEQGLAEGGQVGGQPPADAGDEAYRVAGFAAGQVQDVGVVAPRCTRRSFSSPPGRSSIDT